MARTQQQGAESFKTPVVTPKPFDYSSVDVRVDGSKSDVHLLERVEKLEEAVRMLSTRGAETKLPDTQTT